MEFCDTFLRTCFDEDDCNYLFEILLECSDILARQNVVVFLKYLLNKLKLQEREFLYEMETVELIDAKNEKYTEQRPKSLYARFTLKCFALLNT